MKKYTFLIKTTKSAHEKVPISIIPDSHSIFPKCDIIIYYWPHSGKESLLDPGWRGTFLQSQNKEIFVLCQLYKFLYHCTTHDSDGAKLYIVELRIMGF